MAVFILLAGFAGKQKSVPMSTEKLGEMLFFDPILSEDRSISCGSCHKPEFAFADTAVISPGVHGRLGTRNAPTAMNMGSRESFFWDGRAATLEAQALFPIADPAEMNLPVDSAIARLRNSSRHRQLFYATFRQQPTRQNLALALASFERSLETDHTPNDRWLRDEPGGMTDQQVRGRTVFREKGKCFDCHFTPDFTGDEFRSIGLFNGRTHTDSGRARISHNMADLGKFKVPGLRNVAVTAPYMHDGSFKTLREVIDYYDNPKATMPDGMNRDSLLLQPLGLTEQEKQDLEAFLHALTDDRFVTK
jgi:cytochrome c peroxidase